MAFQLTKLKNERNETSSTSKQPFKVIKRRQSTRRPFAGYSFLQILSFLNPPRLREVWAHPHSFARFDIVEARFTDGQYDTQTSK